MKSRKPVHPDQLDLFVWFAQQPVRKAGELVCFPSSARRRAMREIAAEVLALPKSKQQKKLDLEVGLLRLRMQRQRFPSAEIESQTIVFREGIESEMRRQKVIAYLKGVGEQPGDAA